MIVTAEAYSAVRQPRDVVVLENQLREYTIGSREPVHPNSELFPRGQYRWLMSDSVPAELANAPKVSSKEYDALLELHQAQSAVGIAATAEAD
jgi:hypothetical protein